MNIAIIGGGFTGLSAAYKLSKRGHAVALFEKEKYLGGLTYGFKKKHWDWYLEGAYHHVFTNDTHILDLAHELHVPVITKRPITATLWRNHMYQLDSPYHLFAFPALSMLDKIRTAAALGFLKTFPFWKLLEGITAEHFLISIGGINAWKSLWEPLLYGKFGELAPTVSLAWFWARIVKRTPSLCYIEGGFHTLVEALRVAIISHGGNVYTSTAVESIQSVSEGSYNVLWEKHKRAFDRILLTIPSPIAFNLIPTLGYRYSTLSSIPHLHAQTIILETDKPILKDVYWLNVTDRSFPFLAAVAHTNFMDPSHYGGNHLTYFGNYLPHDHPYLSMNANQLLHIFLPYIHRLSPNLKFEILHVKLFIGPYAQPVHQLHYSRKIPPIQTPIPGVYLANMDYVVPWDRGTNYAVELGQRAARIIHENS